MKLCILVALALVSSTFGGKLNLVSKSASTNTCVPQTNKYCEIINWLHQFEAFYNENGGANLLDIIPDDETFDWILRLGLQQLVLASMDSPGLIPLDMNSLVPQLLNIVDILNENGSGAITFSQLKPIIHEVLSVMFSSKQA